MAVLEYDVLNVEGSPTGVYNAIRARQLGFENSDTHRLIHKEAGGTVIHWTPDQYISHSATGTQYSNPSYPTLSNVQDALDQLLAPEIAISSFGVSPTLLEKGATGAQVSCTWGLTGGGITMTLVDKWAAPGALDPITDVSFTYPANYTGVYGPTGSYAHTLTITDGVTTKTNTVTTYLGQYKFIGQSASASPDEAAIEATLGGTKWLLADEASSKTTSSRTQNGGGNYVYIAYPLAWGALNTLVVNGFSTTWGASTVAITNAKGYVENYTCYVSPYTITGSITIATT